MARPYQPGADMSFFCPQNFCISYANLLISGLLLLNHMIILIIGHCPIRIHEEIKWWHQDYYWLGNKKYQNELSTYYRSINPCKIWYELTVVTEWPGHISPAISARGRYEFFFALRTSVSAMQICSYQGYYYSIIW